ncbi:ABC transporter permease [Paenibacillus daejeonensis]|uniref:ABC transporter permease n=1 Tax=Paenibacillus daejeonensis TaxID=135193 RepID=UPI0003826D8B|nr:ABC transporter permease [Paenibacillus daejeonensis]
MQQATTSEAPALAPGGGRLGMLQRLFFRFAGIGPLLILLCVVIAVMNPVFLSFQNWVNLLNSVAAIWIMAMAMTMVLLTAGFDLSVGSMLALSGVGMVNMMSAGVPEIPAILLTLAAAALIGGLTNGLLIGRMGLNFFVVTLGTMTLYRGIVYVWTNGQTLYASDYRLVQWIGNGKVGPIPVTILLMGLVFLAVWLMLRYTNYGRSIYVVGGNPTAARLAGMNVSLILISVYALAAMFAGLAGIVETGRLASASPTVGMSTELLVAAAVLLGGTSFRGGEGGVAGTALGVLFIAVLQNGLGLSGISSYWQNVITGVILIFAIMLNHFKSKRG